MRLHATQGLRDFILLQDPLRPSPRFQASGIRVELLQQGENFVECQDGFGKYEHQSFQANRGTDAQGSRRQIFEQVSQQLDRRTQEGAGCIGHIGLRV